MKFYVYISDAKVDMLLPQIPHDTKQKVATEFGIDLKVLTAKRRSETESEQDRIGRLETVSTFIREHENVGSVDEPDEYIDDTLPMRWGPYGWDDKAPMVYFGGETKKTILGMGGSVQHVVGSMGSSSPTHSHSVTPYLLGYLKERLDIPESHNTEQKRRDWGLMAVHLATTQMRGPLQQLQFLAKRLQYGPNPYEERGPSPGMYVLLASPLYVALAD